jgi:3-methyladenine DNA glycosylase AlkC
MDVQADRRKPGRSVPDALKDFFDASIVQGIAREMQAAYPPFAGKTFIAECMAGLEPLSLTGRGWHVADVLKRHLPESYAESADILIASLGPELETTEGWGMAPFRYMPHVFYVAKYGLEDFESSMRAQHALTQRFSAEFSIRAFLVRYPHETYSRLRDWASDPSVHVRRLVSEGTRPRLPWAPRLHDFQQDPSPVIALLDLLKDDPELYVRRSVANNVNDIAKDHPDRAADLCRSWVEDASPERRWVIQHALRSLVKQGNQTALEILGFAGTPSVQVKNLMLNPNPLRIGDSLRFSCDLFSTARETQDLLVDFRVHFVKGNGRTAPKVFKLRQVNLRPGEYTHLDGRVSLAVLTTRQPHPGRHALDLIVNGIIISLAEFDVTR